MPQYQPESHDEPNVTESPPNILTIRIYHDKHAFEATMKTRLASSSAHKSTCSCYRVPRVWPGASFADKTSRRNVTLAEVPQQTTVMRFIFWSAARTQQASDLCKAAKRAPNSVPFRTQVQRLLKTLATICESPHKDKKPKSSIGSGVPVRPFRTSRLENKFVSEELRDKIMAPLAPSEVQRQGMGYIYILRSQMGFDTMSVLKIGFSKYHPEHRAHELAGCLTLPEVVAHTPLIPHAKRVESLIHAELVSKRKVQTCGQCGQEHKEWFTISHGESREVVTRWSRWILRQPYIDGSLSDKGKTHLQRQSFQSTKCDATELRELWNKILHGSAFSGTDSGPEDQLASYVNACYWSNSVERLMGPSRVSFSTLHESLRKSRKDGKPIELHDFLQALDQLVDTGEIPSLAQFAEVAYLPQDKEGPKTRADMCDYLEHMKHIEKLKWEIRELRGLQTGTMSVSDARLGITESPMGDATLLPVLSLKEVKKLDAPARNWIGYNPTHSGFQFIQEAFKRGEWYGSSPLFKLPKGFRKAGITQLSAEESAKNQARFGQATPKGGCKLTRDAEGDKWEFSLPLTDEYVEKIKEGMEVMKTPLGRALMEEKMIRSFKNFGLDFSGGLDGDELSSGDESSDDNMDDEMMDIDEPEDTSSETPMGNKPVVSKANAKRWLASL